MTDLYLIILGCYKYKYKQAAGELKSIYQHNSNQTTLTYKLIELDCILIKNRLLYDILFKSK